MSPGPRILRTFAIRERDRFGDFLLLRFGDFLLLATVVLRRDDFAPARLFASESSESAETITLVESSRNRRFVVGSFKNEERWYRPVSCGAKKMDQTSRSTLDEPSDYETHLLET